MTIKQVTLYLFIVLSLGCSGKEDTITPEPIPDPVTEPTEPVDPILGAWEALEDERWGGMPNAPILNIDENEPNTTIEIYYEETGEDGKVIRYEFWDIPDNVPLEWHEGIKHLPDQTFIYFRPNNVFIIRNIERDQVAIQGIEAGILTHILDQEGKWKHNDDFTITLSSGTKDSRIVRWTIDEPFLHLKENLYSEKYKRYKE